VRRAVRIPAAAFATTSFLSDTLDWLNPWHNNVASQDIDDGFEQVPQEHIYPQL
jgi:hypothetical protein